MPKAESQPAEPAEMLEEFCAHVSMTDRRVELIAGFHADEKRAQHARATRAEWQRRFAAFQRRPVS